MEYISEYNYDYDIINDNVNTTRCISDYVNEVIKRYNRDGVLSYKRDFKPAAYYMNNNIVPTSLMNEYMEYLNQKLKEEYFSFGHLDTDRSLWYKESDESNHITCCQTIDYMKQKYLNDMAFKIICKNNFAVVIVKNTNQRSNPKYPPYIFTGIHVNGKTEIEDGSLFIKLACYIKHGTLPEGISLNYIDMVPYSNENIDKAIAWLYQTNIEYSNGLTKINPFIHK